MSEYFILGVLKGDHFEISTKGNAGSPIAYTRENLKREYDSLAYRIGASNIKVFQEVHVFSKTVCSLPDEVERR
jgi:hypothetical protein